MSVRIALAKLCACAAGGALLGGGAVHLAEQQHPIVRPTDKVVRQHVGSDALDASLADASPSKLKVRHRPTKLVSKDKVVHRSKTVPRPPVAECPPATVKAMNPPAPVPLHPLPEMSGGGGKIGRAHVCTPLLKP